MKTGAAFPDYITTSKRFHARRSFAKDKIEDHTRGILLPILFFVFVSVLLFKLLQLQVFQGWYYKELSDSNRTHTTLIHGPRGVIFDRNNVPLVFNIPGFRKRVGSKTVFLEREKALTLLANGDKGLEVDTLRKYPYKDEFAHVLGFIGQISKEELDSPLYQMYHVNDVVGKFGVEQEYESLLKGIDGKKLVEVDSLGRSIRTLGQTDPISGQDITLTLDAKLQHAVFTAMESVKKGAAIVSFPTEEILALVSKPSFDPNLFTLGENYEASQGAAYTSVSSVLLDNENQPFLNRAIAGLYPPGSTFKLVNAASGLENKIIDESYEVNDTGVIRVGEFSFANWYFTGYGKTEGMVNIVKAIKRSNDIFFYKLAEKVGVEKVSAMARRFGLGNQLGIDLKGEAKGTVPDPLWKERVIKEPWYLGDTYHYGIGQGYLLVTPLQVNTWTATIANGGTLYKPHLIKNTTNTTNTTNNPIRKNVIGEKTISLIREGMIESCSPGGAAWPLFGFKIKNEKLKIDGKNFLEVPGSSTSALMKDYRQVVLACKTGTAEHGGKQTLPHAWITLFAPAYNPQIVVTVLAESSGEGSNIAAPIAKKILEEWFGRNLK